MQELEKLKVVNQNDKINIETRKKASQQDF